MDNEEQNTTEKPVAPATLPDQENLKGSWQLLKEACGEYRVRFATCFAILSVPIALSLIVNGLSYATMFPPFAYMPLLSEVKIVFSLLFLFFNVIAAFAILLSIREGYGAKVALVQATRNSLSYIFVSFLVCSSLIGGSLLFLIPGLLFLVWFSFSFFVFVFEGKRGIDALLRSKQLFFGNFWRVSGRMSFLAIILLILTIPLAMLGQYAGHWGNLVLEVFTLLFAPVMLLYSLLLFRDLVRVQGNAVPVTSKTSFKVFVWLCVLLGTPSIVGMILFRSMLLVTHDIPEPDDSDLQLPILNIPREENAYYVFSEISEDEIYWPTDRGNLDNMLIGESWDDALAQEILQKNAYALDVFERGLALPIFQQPELQDPDRYDSSLERAPVGHLRSLSYVSLLKAQSLFKSGMEVEAFDQVLKIVKFGQMLEDTQGTLIDYLVGIAIKDKGLKTLRSFLQNSHVSSVELLQYGVKLNEYSENKLSMERVEKVEYIIRKHSMERIFDPIFRGEQSLPSEEIISPGTRSLLSEREKGFFYYQPNATKQLNIKIFRERIANAKRDIFVEEDTTEAVKARAFINPDFLGTQMLKRNAIGRVLVAVDSVSGSGLNKKRFEEKFSVKATQTLLALKAYEQDKRTLPNFLQELVPAYLSEVPQDPFDGKEIRYVPERRILYSTGEDLIDDGGDIDEENWQEGKDIGFPVK